METQHDTNYYAHIIVFSSSSSPGLCPLPYHFTSSCLYVSRLSHLCYFSVLHLHLRDELTVDHYCDVSNIDTMNFIYNLRYCHWLLRARIEGTYFHLHHDFKIGWWLYFFFSALGTHHSSFSSFRNIQKERNIIMEYYKPNSREW